MSKQMANGQDVGKSEQKARANELAQRFRGGDERAFDELVLMFQGQIFGLAYRLLNNNREDADDAAQEIFVKVYRSISKFRGDAGFSTWLYTIAVNTCRSRMRKTKRRSSFEVRIADRPGTEDDDYPEPVAVDHGSLPDKVLQMKELRRNVARVVADLPGDFATVMVMRDLQDMSYEEISVALGCSMGTVKSRICRARVMAREKLKRYCAEL
jgi:RNA polymerase sigma-70 factor (ECF subfamily)